MNVEGGAALVAAESTDITIPISGGLFDIAVQTGSNVDAGGETTLTHTGTTERATRPDRRQRARLPDGGAQERRGHDARLRQPRLCAGGAGAAGRNGAIYLTTGTTVSNDTPAVGAEGTVRITGGDFGGRTAASADTVTIDTSTAALSFATDLQALSNSGPILLSAQDGRNLTIGGASCCGTRTRT